MPTNENFSGVSNCYVFKSRLQEYAQKVGLSTPIYETIKEGPSHEPSFKSTVAVNGVRYDSLPGFFNRKAAEQSAAEVALKELFKAGEVTERISQPVHETGLCKNLLQEYAQKMNYAIPVYQCQTVETPGRLPNFSCTVEIGGIRYIGATARTKKEAEIKVARTALLAIQSSTSELSDKAVGNSQLTVVPCRKRAMETASDRDETVNPPKAKQSRFKKKMLKTKLSGNNADHSQDETAGDAAIGSHDMVQSEGVQTDSFTVLSSETLGTEVMKNIQDTKIESESSEREMPPADVALAPQLADDSNLEAPDVENSSNLTNLIKLSDGDMVASMVNDPTPSQLGSSKIMHGLNQAVDGMNRAVETVHTNADQA
ncbi:hypothetical protein PTKIN_Ptkin09bG0204000 [Pterospermum kingtungense]